MGPKWHSSTCRLVIRLFSYIFLIVLRTFHFYTTGVRCATPAAFQSRLVTVTKTAALLFFLGFGDVAVESAPPPPPTPPRHVLRSLETTTRGLSEGKCALQGQMVPYSTIIILQRLHLLHNDVLCKQNVWLPRSRPFIGFPLPERNSFHVCSRRPRPRLKTTECPNHRLLVYRRVTLKVKCVTKLH